MAIGTIALVGGTSLVGFSNASAEEQSVSKEQFKSSMEQVDEEVLTQVKELREQMKNGEITKEEMKEQFEELGFSLPYSKRDFGAKGHFGFAQDLDEETREQMEAIKEQVKNGELSKDEAKTQLEELGITHPSKPQDNLDEETKAQLESIKEQVKNGEITKEEAQEKLEALGVELPPSKRHHHGMKGQPFADVDEETRAQIKEIFEQVKSGDLTKEEAQQQLEELGVDISFGMKIPHEHKTNENSSNTEEEQQETAL